jgi:methyl-accepting chemotaxis protein
MQEEKPPKLQATALKITSGIGSVASIVIHTLIFVASFLAVLAGLISFDRMLLILTTIVSLEAIYLAIFIQMTINIQQQSLQEVEQDIDEIQEDIDEIQEDVDEIAEDVDEIAEDVEEMSEEDAADEAREEAQHKTLEEIRGTLGALMKDLEHLQNKK